MRKECQRAGSGQQEGISQDENLPASMLRSHSLSAITSQLTDSFLATLGPRSQSNRVHLRCDRTELPSNLKVDADLPLHYTHEMYHISLHKVIFLQAACTAI